VWGKRAAQHIAQQHPDRSAPDPDLIPVWQYIGEEVPDPALIGQDMSMIKNMMWNYVGLVRTTDRLNRALRELRHLETEIERFYRSSKLTDGLIGLRNAVRTAVIVTMAAWENKQSMGCHYRE
jgi:L-aspartate oxidase